MTEHDGVPLSGTATTLEAHGYRAEIASIGASLRRLTFEGRDLTVPYGVDEVRPAFRGAILAPWPNRIVDGRYRLDGEEFRLALTEPKRGHALHGLLAWADWAVVEEDEARVRLEAVIPPSDGYPFRVRVGVEYALDAEGLVTTVDAVNVGAGRAPYGTAPHPYLVAGEGRVDDWTFQLDAARYLEVTDDRLVPLDERAVTEREGFDFRASRRIGAVFVDHAFTALGRTDGVASATLTNAEGRGVRMTWGEELPWVQVHTADQPDPAIDRLGLAVEPMTCPPDAFNSGVDVVWLAPGERHEARWRLSAI